MKLRNPRIFVRFIGALTVIVAVVVLFVFGLKIWHPRQLIGESCFSVITVDASNIISIDIVLAGDTVVVNKSDTIFSFVQNEEDDDDGDKAGVASAVYELTRFPLSRNAIGQYFVTIKSGETIKLNKPYYVLYIRPKEMDGVSLVMISSIYIEDANGDRIRSVPSIASGLPSFDPLIGAGYLAFPQTMSTDELTFNLTYMLDPGKDSVYGPKTISVELP